MEELKNSSIAKWEPATQFPKTVYILGLYDDFEGFRIVLKEENTSNLFKFTFENHIAYRNSDESTRLKSIPEFPKNTREWCLFQTNRSPYIDWISEESNGLYLSETITHYFFVTPDDIVEVLSLDEPKFEQL